MRAPGVLPGMVGEGCREAWHGMNPFLPLSGQTLVLAIGIRQAERPLNAGAKEGQGAGALSHPYSGSRQVGTPRESKGPWLQDVNPFPGDPSLSPGTAPGTASLYSLQRSPCPYFLPPLPF